LSKKELDAHMPHLAKDVIKSDDYGDLLAKSLQSLLTQAQDIVQEARNEQMYKTALDGLKVMGNLLTTQAKIMGYAPQDQKNNFQVNLSLSPQDVSKLAEDFTSTVEVETPNVSNQSPEGGES
jgi:hypothetical protein